MGNYIYFCCSEWEAYAIVLSMPLAVMQIFLKLDAEQILQINLLRLFTLAKFPITIQIKREGEHSKIDALPLFATEKSCFTIKN